MQHASSEKDTAHKEKLRLEIAEAHREWESANRFFDYAVGNDQIDYAIHCIITAEKRYEMLLRTAKRAGEQWPAWGGIGR
ncbi:DUF2508 family protein [Paenibacillus sinopodophylli]|uniref:DUF2508 family protein n=1 Tax=Paenibacillus sinopodophylli TaxID=1837342 RepID=UPI00110CB243|nr:DUF2508 family protein [Paenibacillus sinopodophylli]